MQLDRDDLIEGLRDVVRQAHEHNVAGASIRIVGGAALRLAYFDRSTTADIDAQIEPMDALTPIIADVARRRGWPTDWLNNNALPERTLRLLDQMVSVGLPDKPRFPQTPDFT